MIVWLVGLSGAGKSTIAREMHKQWQAKDPATVLIDGDEVRGIFKHDSGPEAYTTAGRRVNAERIAAMCVWLDRQNINGLYAAARAGEMPDVVSIDIPFPTPKYPNLVIPNDGPYLNACAVAADILAKIGNHS